MKTGWKIIAMFFLKNAILFCITVLYGDIDKTIRYLFGKDTSEKIAFCRKWLDLDRILAKCDRNLG